MKNLVRHLFTDVFGVIAIIMLSVHWLGLADLPEHRVEAYYAVAILLVVFNLIGLYRKWRAGELFPSEDNVSPPPLPKT